MRAHTYAMVFHPVQPMPRVYHLSVRLSDHHLTSILPERASILTPLKGLYMTSPRTFS